jgi:CheY-like chemotaxis protein
MTEKTVHFLVVDDDEVDVMAVKRGFKKAKIANPVLIAADGLEALAMLRGEAGYPKMPKPYIILLDLNMPRMNGFEFLKELRQDPEHKQAVVFVLTSSKDEEQRVEAYGYGIAGYVVKSRMTEDFLKLAEMLDIYWRVVELP